MKVTMVGYTVPQSNIQGTSRGIANYVYYTGSELVKMGNDVELLVRDDLKPAEPWIKTIRAPHVGWVPYPFFVWAKIRGMEADVFHADYVHTGAPLIWAKKRPTVVAIHDVLPFSYRREDLTFGDVLRVKWYMRNFKTIERADAIIVASEHAKSEALEKTNIPEEKIHAIHYGIDSERLRPMERAESDKIKIGYLGGLDARKNVALLVECFKELSKRYDNIELHLGGTGRSFEKFKSMNVPRMFMHGPVRFEDVPTFLNSLDMFVFPTLGEGFGLPVCEAMSCGVPVVASNVTTMPELVGDAGLLAAPNKEEMSDAMSKMIESRELRQRLGKKGRERAEQLTWRSAAEKTMQVYEGVRT